MLGKRRRADQQLQVTLGDHIDSLAVLEYLRKLAAFGNEVGRQAYPFDAAEIEYPVVLGPRREFRQPSDRGR